VICEVSDIHFPKAYIYSEMRVCAAHKKAITKKDVKSKVAAKKWLDGRLMAKILITTILVNLVPNPVEKATQIHLKCCY